VTTAVVKVGTSSLTDSAGTISLEAIERVAAGIAQLRADGHTAVLVTSGAIAAGLPELGMDATNRPTDAVTLQAASSVGLRTTLVSAASICMPGPRCNDCWSWA
jgi:glutamate 5-kinase